MLGARGVALGLGRVNLSDLNTLRPSRQTAAAMKKSKTKEKPRRRIKKSVDRQTLWAVIRAVIFGTILIGLGATMAGLGYYADAYARVRLDNGTEIVDAARRIQIQSLSYVGPIVMGVGAFVLMIACVMTLESRDKNARIVHDYPKEAASRKASTRSRRPGTEEEQKPLTSVPEQSERNDVQSNDNNNNREEEMEPDGQPSVVRGMREMKIAEWRRGDSDSVPHSTTTTTLTFSKSIRDSEFGKFPSTSCIDAMSKNSDTRALLQRFLEDQSHMANRMRHRSGIEGTASLKKKQSNSLEIPGSEKLVAQRNVRSEEMPIRHSIVAEVHPPPVSGPDQLFPSAPLAAKTLPARSCRGHRDNAGVAPIVRPESVDALETAMPDFTSPMSVSSDTGTSPPSADSREERTHQSNASMTSFVTVRTSRDSDDENGNDRVRRFHSITSALDAAHQTPEVENRNNSPLISAQSDRGQQFHWT